MFKRRLSLIITVIMLLQLCLGSQGFSLVARASSFIATPYTTEEGVVVPGLEEAVTKPGKESWLETTRDMPVSVTVNDSEGTITMANEVLSRRFKVPQIGETNFYTESYENLYTEQEMLSDTIYPEVYLGIYDKGYTQIYSGETINEVPAYYYIGGTQIENTFVFNGYEIFDTCEKPFEWSPNKSYSSPVANEWPPKGKRVIFKFKGQDTWADGFKDLEIQVIYEMYDNITAMKKRVEITNTGSTTVTIGKLAPSVFHAADGMESQIHLETDFAMHKTKGGAPVTTTLPCGCENEPAGSPFDAIKDLRHTCYEIGPAYELKANESFKSFNSFELLFSTYWFELRSKEVRGMYTRLFPWVTDNPITYHCTGTLNQAAIDHAAQAGFEMIIQSYAAPDSSSQMLTRNQYNLDKYKDLVDYAHSKGIEIGIYQAQYTRGQYKQSASYGTNGIGTWGTWCLASAAFDDYWDNFKYFLEYTGVDCVEIDGTYPGCACNNGELHVNSDKETDPGDPSDTTTGKPSKYAVHYGYHDSVVKQWENSVRMMNKTFRDLDVYIKVPDWYFLSGGNKGAIGYEEVAWSQPRKEQLLYGRQIIHNSSYLKPLSMSWSHIPFSQYQGGGDAATFIPFSEKLEDYNWVLAQNLGNGVTSDYRGTMLFDSGSLHVMKRWVDFYKKYRGIVNSDMVKISQATYAPGSDRQTTTRLDALFHANANNQDEKGLLWVYNQSNEERTETITVPMYYTGLTNMAYPQVPVVGSLGKNVKKYWKWPPDYSWIPSEEANYTLPDVEEGVSTGTAQFLSEGYVSQVLNIDSNGYANLEVTMPPMSFTYYMIYPEGQGPQVSVDVGKVTGLTADTVTDKKATLSWNADVPITLTVDGEIVEDHELQVTSYNIYRNGQKVGNSLTNTYTDTGLTSGETYTYEVEAMVGDNAGSKSDALSINTTSDQLPPEWLSVNTVDDGHIVLTFDEELNATVASDTSHYSLSPSLSINSATVASNVVELQVDAMTALTKYTLTVTGIEDLVGNASQAVNKSFTYGYLRHYPLEDVSGGKTPDLIAGEDAHVYNVSEVNTSLGNALLFNASAGSYGDLGSEIFKDQGAYTLSVWMKTDSSNKQVLISQGQEAVDENDFTLTVDGHVPHFKVSNTDASSSVTLSGNSMTANKWHHIAVTHKDQTYKLFVDGQVVDTSTGHIIPGATHTLLLGAKRNNAGGDRVEYFNGHMKALKLYSIGLSDADILEIYDAMPKPGVIEEEWHNLSVRDGVWTMNSDDEILAPLTEKDEVIVRKDTIVSEGILTGDVRLGDHDGQKQGFVIGWGNDTSDAAKQQGYEILLAKNGRVALHKSGTGDLATADITTDLTGWVPLEVTFSDDAIKVKVNNEEVINYTNNVNIVDNSYVGLFSVIYPFTNNAEQPRFRNFAYSELEEPGNELEDNWKNLSVRDGVWTYANGLFTAPITEKDEVLIYKNVPHNQGTVECKVMAGTDDGQKQGLVIGWGNDTSDASKQQGYEILLKKDQLKLHKSGTGDLSTADYTLPDNQWVTLKAVYTTSSVDIYVDDQLLISNASISISDNSYVGFFSVIYPYNQGASGPQFKDFQLTN